MDGHSSWPIVADRLQQPTRTSGAVTPAGEPARHPYSVLLQAGFTVPPPLPSTRWALTPPFHPYRPRKAGGLLSVALSLGSPRAGVTRRLFTVEPGLSSTGRNPPRPSDRLAGGQMRARRPDVNSARARRSDTVSASPGSRLIPGGREESDHEPYRTDVGSVRAGSGRAPGPATTNRAGEGTHDMAGGQLRLPGTDVAPPLRNRAGLHRAPGRNRCPVTTLADGTRSD